MAAPGQKNRAIVLDVTGNPAAATTVSPDQTDPLQRAKVNGEWKIVNVLWVPVEP